MKILFVGDASNLHNCLASALRKMGHQAVVASNGSNWMNTERDINLYRKNNSPIHTLFYLLRLAFSLPKMRGFDIVELVNPIFLNLKPQKVMWIYKYLRKYNKKLVLSALGTDYFYVKTCYEGQALRYNEYFVHNNLTDFARHNKKDTQRWLSPQMKKHTFYLVKDIDGIIACLPEYFVTYAPLYPHKTFFVDIPIDTKSIEPNFIPEEPEKVKFFIGLQKHRMEEKGTDKLLNAAKRICEKYPDKAELKVVSNVPYKEYLKEMESSHVILDQIYSYTPATNALLAMAHGLVAVSGAEPEYYDFIGEKDNQPIINVLPDQNDIYNKLEWIVLNKHLLPKLSRQSRAFVEKHNDNFKVAQQYLKIWEKL